MIFLNSFFFLIQTESLHHYFNFKRHKESIAYYQLILIISSLHAFLNKISINLPPTSQYNIYRITMMIMVINILTIVETASIHYLLTESIFF